MAVLPEGTCTVQAYSISCNATNHRAWTTSPACVLKILKQRPCEQHVSCSAFRYELALMTETKTAPKTAAFMKALTPSSELAAIVGAQPLPRTEVTKRIWDYIKARNLQNPANKRNVLCDEALRAVMGKDEVTMFEMTKLVSQHLS
jgi:chromatin remodeling complex protein RSC6